MVWVGLFGVLIGAWAHPLDTCDVRRASTPPGTTVTFDCGPHEVSERRYFGSRTRAQRLEQFHEELEIVGKANGATVTWNTADIDIGGASRPVAQYMLKAPEGARSGLVAAKDADGSTLVDCSTVDMANATVCRDLVDILISDGLPEGVTHLPAPRDVKKAQVMGQTVNVIIGCKAQFVFNDAIHIACPDGQLLFGSQAALLAAMADPIAGLKEEMAQMPEFASSEPACTVAGVSTRCWRGRARVGGVAQLSHTATFNIAGEPGMVLCRQTAVGTQLHDQCSKVMSVP